MTYHSLTPRQQRVWDAAYGAAMAHFILRCVATSLASNESKRIANDAANSIQPNETEPNECHT